MRERFEEEWPERTTQWIKKLVGVGLKPGGIGQGWVQKLAGAISHPGGDGQRRSPADPGFLSLEYLAAQRDPWWDVMDVRQDVPSTMALRLHVGAASQGRWQMTAPRRNLLVLGPPRSDKTSAIVIPAILSAPGPTVVVSTRKDVFRSTALVRSRLGRVWHYSPDGSPTPPGALELRWSPITGSRDWSTAVEMAEAMTLTTRVAEGTTDASYWRQKSSGVLAPLLHAAALGGKDMRWVVRAVRGQHRAALEQAQTILSDALGDDAELADDDLRGILMGDAKHRNNVFSTAATALDVYRFSGALAATENPNFDPAAFVAGDPEAWNSDRWEATTIALTNNGVLPTHGAPLGIYDTVYITASADRQEMVAPLVVGLLAEIRKAAYARHEQDLDERSYRHPPVTFVLDELYGMAPLPDLPTMLVQCTGNNLYVVGVLHDLAQARAKWKDAGESFPTVFGTVIAFPRIGDGPTLELLSKFSGQHWQKVETTSTSAGTGSGGATSGWSDSTTQQLIPRLDPGAIHYGMPERPDLMLVFGLEESLQQPPSYRYVTPTPYYATPPWVQLIVRSMTHFVHVAGYGRVDRRCELPVPELDLDGNGHHLRTLGGEALYREYHEAKATLASLAALAAERLATLAANPWTADYDDACAPEYPELEAVGVHVAHRPSLAELDKLMEKLGAERRGPPDDVDGGPRWYFDNGVAVKVGPKHPRAESDQTESYKLKRQETIRLLGVPEPSTIFVAMFHDRLGHHVARKFARAVGSRIGCVASDSRGWFEYIPPRATGSPHLTLVDPPEERGSAAQ